MAAGSIHSIRGWTKYNWHLTPTGRIGHVEHEKPPARQWTAIGRSPGGLVVFGANEATKGRSLPNGRLPFIRRGRYFAFFRFVRGNLMPRVLQVALKSNRANRRLPMIWLYLE